MLTFTISRWNAGFLCLRKQRESQKYLGHRSKGRVQIKKKVGNFPYLQDPPPAPPSKVGNLFMIFFYIQGSNLRCFLTQFTTFGTREKGVQGYSYWIFSKEFLGIWGLFGPLKAHKKAESESILSYIPLQNKK